MPQWPGRRGGFDVVQIASQIGRAWRNTAARKRMAEASERERQRQDQVLSSPPTIHGSARWTTPAEARAANLLQPDSAFDHRSSILLGAMTNDSGGTEGFLHWDGEGHLLTVAPTRSGKSTSVIVPNLLRYQGSCVVLDLKGELYETTSAWRGKHVGPVYRISPFDSWTDGFNPLATIDSPSDARGLADLMIPTDPKSSDFFKKDAVAFLTAVLLFARYEPSERRRTMAEVRRLTTLPMDQFIKLIEGMMRSTVPAVRNAANVVHSKSRDRGLASLRETLNADLALFDDPGIIAATNGRDVDFKALKDQHATVYVTVPFEKIDAYAPFVKLVLTCALDAMVQNRTKPDTPVLFVLDEFLPLGPFEKFQTAIMTHAGAGVRLWFFLQNLAKLEQHYPTSWKSFFDAAVQMFFGTKDDFTGKLISEMLGDATVAYRTSSLSAGMSRNAADGWAGQDPSETITLNTSVQMTARSLLDPPEVVKFLSPVLPDGTRNAIIKAGDLSMKARLVPYYLGQRSMARLGQLKK